MGFELSQSDDEGDEMLSRIITGDETWTSHTTPESKQQSMEWSNPGQTSWHAVLSKGILYLHDNAPLV